MSNVQSPALLDHTRPLAIRLLAIPIEGDHPPPTETLHQQGFTALQSDYHTISLFRAIGKLWSQPDQAGAYRAQLVKTKEGQDYVLMIGGTKTHDEMMMNMSSVLQLMPAPFNTPPQLKPLQTLYQAARNQIIKDMASMPEEQRQQVRFTIYGHSMGGWLAMGLSTGDLCVDLNGKQYKVPEHVLSVEAPGAENLLEVLGRTPAQIESLAQRSVEILTKLGPQFSTYPTAVGGAHIANTICVIDKSKEVESEREAGLSHWSLREMLKQQSSLALSGRYHRRDILRDALLKGDYTICGKEDLCDKQGFPTRARQTFESDTSLMRELVDRLGKIPYFEAGASSPTLPITPDANDAKLPARQSQRTRS